MRVLPTVGRWTRLSRAASVSRLRTQLISGAFFKPEPPDGVGMDCAQGGENSYAEVTVTSDKLKVEYKDEDGNILLDSDGSTPCGPYLLTG